MNRAAKFFSSEKFGRGAEGKIPNSRMNFVIDEGVIISVQKNLARYQGQNGKGVFHFADVLHLVMVAIPTMRLGFVSIRLYSIA